LLGKLEGTNPLGITRRGRDDDIEINLKEIGFEGVDFIRLVKDQEKDRPTDHGNAAFPPPGRHCSLPPSHSVSHITTKL
jgi:hypothetical protein